MRFRSEAPGELAIMLNRITCRLHARRVVASTMVATLLCQSVLSVSHSHALNAHNEHDLAAHQNGDCGHAPGQSHSDPHADHCAVCAAVLSKGSRPEPLVEICLLIALPIRTERPIDFERDKSHQVHIGSICLRGPPIV
ncbi:hypothetical protein RAS2_09580 [Phycisphaerae bacterium RAS2]|nr:hypothetical protein RAS2_09580 [Phycisphaerae bacterium RAS2]